MLSPSDRYSDVSSMKAVDIENYEDDLYALEQQTERKYSEIIGTGSKRKQGGRSIRSNARPQLKM